MSARLFVGYLQGVKTLLERLGKDNPSYDDVITLQTQLIENIENENNVLETQDSATRRARIIGRLKKISEKELGISFEELCFPESATQGSAINPPKNIMVHAQNDGVGIPIRSEDRLFISYAKEDESFANIFQKDLSQAGLKIWYAKENIRAGQSIIDRITEGLSKCNIFIVILSPASVVSRWVLREIQVAIMEDKIILPVLLQDCQIPLLLRANQYADFRFKYQDGLNEVLNGLNVEQGNNINFPFDISKNSVHNNYKGDPRAKVSEPFKSDITIDSDGDKLNLLINASLEIKNKFFAAKATEIRPKFVRNIVLLSVSLQNLMINDDLAKRLSEIEDTAYAALDNENSQNYYKYLRILFRQLQSLSEFEQ